jgi:hypothetical protein
MIKSKEKPSVPNSQSPCFAESEAASGIAFEKSDGAKRFAPHSLLASVDFDGGCELVFRYSYGTVTVRGQGLQPLWTALCDGTLARVIERATESADQTTASIHAIEIRDEEFRTETPPFPSEA